MLKIGCQRYWHPKIIFDTYKHTNLEIPLVSENLKVIVADG